MIFTRKVINVGNSLATTIPNDICKFWKISNNDNIIFENTKDGILIKKEVNKNV